MPDIIKFLHPALRVFQLVDRNVLKTKQAMDSLVKALLWFTQNKKPVLIAVFEGESSACTEARSCVEKLAQYLTDTGY
uniref:VWFA domain-containing protein n=1 Tax=Panagrellus redivivus TaxID=6233 RepID=A0A7E4USC7_PANRE